MATSSACLGWLPRVVASDGCLKGGQLWALCSSTGCWAPEDRRSAAIRRWGQPCLAPDGSSGFAPALHMHACAGGRAWQHTRTPRVTAGQSVPTESGAPFPPCRPHQVYAAGDLSDPHGTHRTCLQARVAPRMECNAHACGQLALAPSPTPPPRTRRVSMHLLCLPVQRRRWWGQPACQRARPSASPAPQGGIASHPSKPAQQAAPVPSHTRPAGHLPSPGGGAPAAMVQGVRHNGAAVPRGLEGADPR